MPKVGDHVIVEGTKIGNPRREGTCIGIVGRLINVRWNDGTTSMFTPAAGSVTFEPRNGSARAARPAARAKASPKAKTKSKPVAKKSPPRKAKRKKR